MHEDSPFLYTNSKKFLERGTALSQYPTPSGEGDTPYPHPTSYTPRPDAFRASILAPSAPNWNTGYASVTGLPIRKWFFIVQVLRFQIPLSGKLCVSSA